jgi:hypothetical protein
LVKRAVRCQPILLVLLGAALLLVSIAWLRGAEYDEQYTLFLTGRAARPVWSADLTTADEIRRMQVPEAGLSAIARDLRATDVHPPLYFWTVSKWRRLVGGSLFAARMASVLCSIATLCLVAWIARATEIPPVPAVLLTIGCYGFAYTGTVARGFALAQLFNVAGIALLLNEEERPNRALIAGALLGAATFTNYLAAWVGCAALLHTLHRRPVVIGATYLGFILWLPLDMWFFVAQRQSRPDQFPPFGMIPVMTRLAQYSVANVFGGLPLYAEGFARACIAAAVCALSLVGIGALVWRWQYIATSEARSLLTMCAVAPLLGPLLLGLMFANSPIELRYLAFATPFIALLLAATMPRWLRHLTLAVQAVALVGLMTRQETMQPARAAAQAAVPFVDDGVVLLPRGNDGVGIVGAFADEVPDATGILIIAPDTSPQQIRAQAARFSRVVLAMLTQDASSRATVPVMRAALADPCWRPIAEGFEMLAFDRVCAER